MLLARVSVNFFATVTSLPGRVYVFVCAIVDVYLCIARIVNANVL